MTEPLRPGTQERAPIARLVYVAELRAVAPGRSLEIGILLVALGAVGTYRSHVENLAWFAEHVRGIVRRVFAFRSPWHRLVVSTADVSVAAPVSDRSVAAGPGAAAGADAWLRRVLYALLAAAVALVGLVTALLVVVLVD